MILMLIKGDGPLRWELDKLLKSYGINTVHYSNPIKAMDNMGETDPRIILYSLRDFPRHWKIMLKFLREDQERDKTVFLLLAEEKPSLEEANKALFLGVNGILNYSGRPAELAKSIREIFLRYGSLDFAAGRVALHGTPESPLGFAFRHPRRKNLITGILVTLEETWATFKPHFRHETADLEDGDEILQGSLRVGTSLLSLNAKIVRNTGQLHLEIEPASLADHAILKEKLSERFLDGANDFQEAASLN